MAETILINEEQPTLTINEVKAGANENEILVDVSLDQASDLSVSTSFLLMVNNDSESSSEKVTGNISFEKGETSKTIVIKLSSASSSMEDVSISLHSPQNTNLVSRGESIRSDFSSITNETISSSSPLKSAEVSKVYFFNLQDTTQNTFKPTESVVDTLVNLPLSRKEKRAARRLQKTLKEGDIDNQDTQDSLNTSQQADLKINGAPASLGDSQGTDTSVSVSNTKPNRAARRLARALRRAERASKNEVNETNNDLSQDSNQGKASVMTLMVTRDSQEVLPSTDFTTAARTETVASLGTRQMMQMDITLVEKTVTVAPAAVAPVRTLKTKPIKHVKPKISIDDVTSTDETGSQVFTVTLNKVTTGTVFVDYTTVDITAQENTDYTPVTGTLTFTPGTVSQTITVPIIEDTLDEMSENLKVVLSNAVGGKIKDDTGEMTITDDDGISVSPNNVTVTEAASNSTITMTMVLGQPSENDVTVDWETSDRDCGCATNAYAGLDYTAASGTVTFLAGETSQDFTIPLLADLLHETTEKFNIDLSNPTGGAIIDVARATVTIVDNDDPPTLSINNITQAEDAGNATFTVTLSEASGRATKVTYNVPSDTATSGDDFTATSGILTIPAGNLSGTIVVPVIDDALDEEDNETATVTLSSARGATITDATGTLTIVDDDIPPTITIDDISFTEDTSNASLTVTLSEASGKEITVEYQTSDGTAESGADYTTGTGTITIPAGSTTATIDVAVTGDNLDEPNETVNVTLSNPTNASISGDPTGVITIVDDDDTPSLSIDDVIYTESGSAGNATFTVTLSAASSQEVTVNYASSNDTATAASDYTAASGTVTIAAGATSATFNVPVLADTLDEANETATITLSSATNATISDATGTLMIVDDDDAPTLSIGDISFTEATGDATLTVTLSEVSGQDVTVDFATSDDTATAGTDYTTGTGTITIPAGSTSATIDVAVKEDSLDEVDETVKVTLSNPTGATIADGMGVITINDDDDTPSLSINDVSYTESGSAGNATFTVTLSAASGQDIEVDYTTSNGTAASGSDYTASTGTVTILAGNTTQTFNVPVLADTLDEVNETATLTLSNASNATISDATGTLTIVDDDDTPSLSINDVSYTESGSGGNATFTVTLSAASSKEVTVNYASSNSTALAGSDYTAASGTVTIAAGATSATFDVPVLVDTLDEANETATLTLSNPSNATISDATGTLTIVDDDATPSLSINDVSYTESGSAGNATFTVTLSAASAQDVEVDYATSNGTATAGSDYTASTGTVTILAGNTTQTFNVPVLVDTLDEASETATLTLSNASNATISDATGTLTITDDDDAPTLSINDVSYTESGSAGNATFTVTLSEASAQEVRVSYASSDVSTTEDSDYTGISGTVAIAPGSTSATIDLPILVDTLDEASETATLTLSSPTNATISDATGTLTIVDDDDPPSLSINDVSYDESGTAGNATFTVTLSSASSQEVTVNYASSDVSTAAGSDYTGVSGTVTIAAGATSATFNVPVLTDTLDEATETATLTLSDATNATISDATGELEIKDDDTAPTLSINDISFTEATGDATLTVTLSKVSGQDVTVEYGTTIDGTATDSVDYTVGAGTITIPAGSTTATIDVAVIGDSLDEPNETINVLISNPTGATITDNIGVITINDDDDLPTLSIDDVSYTESGTAGNATFTVTLSAASSKEVTVDYASSNNSATAASDYTAVSGTVTIAAGATTATFNVPVLTDTLDEVSETATLTLSNASNATISDATGTLTIVDDDDPPSLSINDVSYTESGSAGNATFTVTLSAASSQEVTVNYASSDVSTAAGSDYTGVSGTVTIAAGATSATFDVPVLADTLDEASETATITLSGATNATISDATGTLTIVDDDDAPTLSIADISFTEATGDATLTVTLSKVSGQDVEVDYATSNGTAASGSDYTAGTGTITIPAGSTSATIDVAITEDSKDEPNETVNVTLSNPTGATIADGTGVITINDDDTGPTLSINDVSYTESDSAGNATFTVTLSEASGQDVEVDYATSNGTAASGSDYTASSGTVTILAGNTTQTFTVPVLVDTLDEASETATLTLSNASNATISDATGTLTIVDDDDAPTLSINDVSYTESGSAGNATFTVTLSEASGQEVTVDYTSSDVSTTAASDYTGVSGTVTIAAGATTATFNVPVLADTLDEASETATLTLSNASNATISDATGTLTIVDDDDAPTLSIGDVSFGETTGNVTVTVTLSEVSGQDVVVSLATSDGTATAGTDYTAGTGTITIPAGSTTATFDVAVTGDSLDEADETINVNLSSPTNATIADGTGVITINDDDTAPTLSINDVSYTESGSAGNATFTVTLSEASGQEVTVDYASSDVSTTEDSDYTGVSGTVTIAAGATSATFNVPVLVDNIDEASETSTLTLSNPSNATISDATGTLTIVDDDATPSLSINDVSYTESGSAGNATFTVTLSAASGQDIEVDYTTSNGTAASGSDYTASTGTVTILAGNTTQTFNVPVLVDTLDEASETATLTLSNASNATISDATGTLTIVDDDDAPTLSIADISFTEATGDATLTVTLSEVSGQDVVVSYATSDDTATAGTDYTAGTGTITIPAGSTSATFNVAVTGDSIDEPNETVNVTLSNPTGATIADGTAVLTINDDDTAPTLSINDVSYTESGSAGNATFTVTLSEASGQDVEVDYATSNGTAASGSDYTASTGTVTILAGNTTQTFTVPVLVDTLDEASETATLTLSNASNATISDATGTLTIVDDDTAPTLSINDVSYTESGSAGNATFTVTLSEASGQEVTVDYASSDVSTTEDSDYTGVSGTVTIAAGATSATFNVPVLVDNIDEASETSTLTLSNPSNATISDATGTLTIVDDETTPTLSVVDKSLNEDDVTTQVTISLSHASSSDITFDWTTSADTAAGDGTDFTNNSGTATITAGNTSVTVDVGIVEDSIDEDNETFNVIISNPSSGATIADNTGVVTIIDDEAVPTVGFASSSSSNAESTSSAAIAVNLSTSSSSTITVNYSLSGTATGSGTDYTLTNGTLTFAAGETSKNITIASIVSDALDEANETVVLTLSDPTNASLGTIEHTYTITDDDDTPTLSINDVSYTESGSAGNATFTVTLSEASGQEVTVDYASSDVSTTEDSDYTAVSGTVTIAAGATSATFDVPVLTDTLDEASETATLTLSNASNATISDATGTLTIVDDDDPPSLSINDVSYTESGSAGNATFTVTLSAASGQDIEVDYTTSNGTAASGSDYTASTGTVTILAGNTTQTFNVPVLADTLDEASETATLTLSNASNATISDATGTLTIVDDDDTPSLSINDVSYTESGSGGNATFTVTLSAASSKEVTVNYASSNSTALAGSDYTAASGTVTIAAGATSATFDVPVLVDTLDEANETATLTLSNPSNATISDATGTLTIVDDDATPSLSINDVSYTESGSAGNATFTVTLSAASAQDVEVDYATSNGTATAGSDYTASTGTVTILAGNTTQTFNVPVLVDTLSEPNETITVTLSNENNATRRLSTGTLTIIDDDVPSLSINDVSYTESGSAGNATFTVTLSEASAQDVEVDYATSNGTAASGSDYTASTGTVTILAGNTTQTFNVPVLVDTLDEVNETATLTLSNASNATISDATGTLTITDDDDAPTLSINDVSYTESGSAGNATFTVTLSEASGKEVTVDYASSNDTATAASDYTAASGTVTIAAGATTQTFTVPILVDTLDEENETATITLSNPTNATIPLSATQIGSNLDGEAANDRNGHSVAISEDGSIVAIGAYLNDGNGTNAGHVRVYQNNSGTWTQIGSDIDGESTYDYAGSSVSLSDDGSIVAIGAMGNAGYVRVYQNNSGTWTQIGSDIDGESSGDSSGSSVSLSEDGSIVAIGAYGNDANGNASGHVRVYQNNSGTWTQIGSDIDGEARYDSSGYSVALSDDGSIVAIGATGNDANGNASGHVRVYQNVSGTWTQIGSDINGEAANDSSGYSVALSDDGSIVAIGAIGNDGNGSSSGHVRVYQNVSGTWTQIGSDIDGEAAADSSGYSVSLSGNGTIVAIGATGNDGTASSAGHVRLYKNNGGTWTQIGSDIDGEAAADFFGGAVALSGDGSAVAIGAWLGDGGGSNSGQASVFAVNTGTGTLTIIDDDDPPTLSINDVSYTESGSAGNATFTVTLSAASTQDVTVDYASSDVNTTEDSDYTGVSGTVTIAAGATTATFNVPVLTDTLDEVNETATMTLSNPSNATISDATGTLTIVDDDDPPTLSINDVSYTESGSAGNATFTVTLSATSTQDVTVDYASSDVNTTEDSDYTGVSGTVTIAAGATTATFNVPVLTDTLDEVNETATLTLSNASNATISDATGTLTIVDDDIPSLSINDVSYTESGSAGNATFTVTLSEVSTKEVTVNYASSNSTALAGSDYTAASGTVTIAAGATTATFSVPVLVDTLDEASETATMTLSGATNATISDATGTLTIVDDDDAPTLSINDVSYTESGSAGNATFTVTLSAASGQEVTVDYASSDVSTTAGSDYTGVSGTVTIAAGATSATFNVPVLADTLDEASETATLTLSNASNATISDATGTLTIVDDDATPSLSINDVSYTESGSAGNATFTVTLSAASGQDIEVDYATSNGTATAGADYTASSGTVTILAGNTTQTFNVPILVDTLSELNETATLTLSNASNATISDATGTLTIVDDDIPSLSINDVSYTESGSAGNATFTVTLSQASAREVTVNYASSNSTALAGSDYTAASGTVTIAAGATSATFDVPVLVDTLDEASETATLTLSNASNATISDATGTLSIVDDDDPPSLSINDVSYTESGSAGNATFTVTLSAASGQDIEVDYATSNGTATAGADYTASSGTVTILAGNTTQTFNVPVLADTLDEASETATLTLSNASNATISDATGTLTITDDDDAPTLSINDVSYTESGSAGNATFTVTLSAASSKEVTVDYASANNSATAASDYTAVSGTVTIAAGATTATFNVPVLTDTLDEANETATLTLSNASNATISDATGTLTIVDDDDPPSLSINDVSYTESGSAGNATFTVTLSEASTQEITFNYASSNSSATAGSDYTAASGTLTIAAGATSATFNVPVLVDTLDEANETAILTISNASNATISDATGTLTIVDDDTPPSLSINNVSYTESGSAGNATFTVTLSEASGQEVTVDYASSNSSATAGSDYTAVSGTVTIAAGNTTQTFNVPVSVDTLDENNETAILTLSNPTNATIPVSTIQIGSDIDGEAANDQSGRSVSLSDDGTVVAIGAYANDGNGTSAGHVRIYENNSGTWSQIGSDIDGEAASDQSSYSISLSGDGSIVAIGARYNDGNGTSAGHVRIYENNSGTWTQIGSDIDGEAASDHSGTAVSLSGDGSIVAIGAYGNDGNGLNAGHVRVYQNNSGTWTQIGSDIDGEAGADAAAHHNNIALSDDGSILAIGAYGNDGNGTNSGHVRVYQNNSGTWTQIGSDIDGEAEYDQSGYSVSLSDDGSIVAIGAYANDDNGTNSGHVRVYQNVSGTWTQIGSDIDGEAAGDQSGLSMSLSGDGSIVAIGAYANDGNGTNSGHVRLYQNISGTWTQIGSDIDGEAAYDSSGWSVSLSGDGTAVAIGAYGNDGNGSGSGHVRVYDTNSGTGTLTIIDDDIPSLSINDVSYTESGSAGNATFTVTLSEVSTKDVSVNYASSNSSATAGSDYTAASGTVTIAAGNTTQTFNVPVLVDTLDEANETAIITLSNASNATISDATGTLTIVDDDTPPSLSINDVSYTESGSAGNATFTVTLSATSTQDVTVNYASSNSSATAGSDYTAVSGTVTIAAGNTTQTFNVPVSVDTLDENNETATITLSGASNATISDATGILTIVDNDSIPSLSINNVSYTESGSAGNATFTVSLSSASGKNIEVDYATSNNTAIAGSDYTARSGTVTILAGNTSQTFTVPVSVDTLDEDNEYAILTLSGATNASISDGTGVLTIVDNDSAPSISISNNAMTENSANLSFTVTLSAASSREITVNYSTANNTATAGSDYTAVSATTLTFAAGQTSKTINVGVLEDTVDENNEYFLVNLTSASNATISDSQAIGTIYDDDVTEVEPSLSINNVGVYENNGPLTFTVTASGTYSQNITFNYATSNGSASSSSDYSAISGTGTITAGSTTKTISVNVTNDSVYENTEAMYLNIGTASNATINDSQGVGYIYNDDAQCDADGITYVSNVVIDNSANNFQSERNAGSARSNDHPDDRFIITAEQVDSQWSGTSSQYFSNYTGGSNNVVYGRNKAGNSTTYRVTDGDYFNSYLVFLNNDVNRRVSGTGTIRFEHNIMGVYIGYADTTSTPSIMSQFEKSGATYATSSANRAGNRHFEYTNGDWISMTTSGTYAYKELTLGAKDAQDGDFMRVITNSCLTDGIVVGVEYTTSSGLKGLTDHEGNFSHYVGDDVTFNIGGVVLGTATAEDLAEGRVFLQDIADVDRTTLNGTYLENMATFLQSLDDNNDAYDNIVISQTIRDALVHESLDLRTASEEEVEQLINKVGGIWVDEEDAMTHVKDMLIKYSDLTEADFEDTASPSSSDVLVDVIDTDLLVDEYKASDNASALEEPVLAGVDESTIDLSDLLDVPGDEIDSLMEENDADDEPANEASVDQTGEGEDVSIDGSAVAPFELVDSLLGEVTTPVEV